MPVVLEGNYLLGTGFRFAKLPALAPSGNRLAFFSAETIPQLWVTDLLPETVHPNFHQLSSPAFSPGYVLTNASTSSIFTINALHGAQSVERLNFNVFIENQYAGRVLRSDYDPSGVLTMYDDGITFGDATASDGTYTQNSVRRDLPDYGEQMLSIRFSAYSQNYVTSLEAGPFYLSEEIIETGKVKTKITRTSGITLYPNPANHVVFVVSNDENSVMSSIIMYNSLGQILYSNNSRNTGSSSINMSDYSSGYYYIMIRLDGELVIESFIKN
jgi:hypothetical protein